LAEGSATKSSEARFSIPFKNLQKSVN